MGPNRGGLVEICEYPQRFGCLLILPEPKPTAPWGEFKVTSAQLDPDRRFGTLTFSRRREDGWNYGPAQVLPGDCLIHMATGATVGVVYQNSSSRVTVEGWTAPRTEEEKMRWLQAPGLGAWVVWGCFFKRYEDIPRHARPPEVVEGEQADAARRDLFRHPERLPWSYQGKAVAINPRQLDGKQRKKFRRYLRRLLGGIHTVQGLDTANLRDIIDKHAVYEKRFKSGGRVIDWHLPCSDE